jgi:hypothetical protein
MSTETEVTPKLQELLKGLSDQEKVALGKALGAPAAGTGVSEDALNKALEKIEERIKRPAAPAAPGVEVDATGFLKNVEARMGEVDQDIRAAGELVKSLTVVVKGMRDDNAALKTAFAEITSIRAEFEAINKALAKPVAGRAVTSGTQVVPSPNDAKPGKTRLDLLDALAKAFEARKSDTGMAVAIGDEINRIQFGGSPNEALFKNLNIPLV